MPPCPSLEENQTQGKDAELRHTRQPQSGRTSFISPYFFPSFPLPGKSSLYPFPRWASIHPSISQPMVILLCIHVCKMKELFCNMNVIYKSVSQLELFKDRKCVCPLCDPLPSTTLGRRVRCAGNVCHAVPNIKPTPREELSEPEMLMWVSFG